MKHIQMIWIDKNKNSLFNLSVKSWICHGYTIDLYTDNLEIVDHPHVSCIDIKEIHDEFSYFYLLGISYYTRKVVSMLIQI